MLREITIENVAVIEKATASFPNGFTALTGETGAGKSILIDSINAILGNRTSKDLIRSGAAKAKIWASFDELPDTLLAQLEEAGYPAEGELLLYREISAEGKSTCRINGVPATAAILRDLCANLITIHGQHDNQNLLNPAKHIDLLDAFAHNETLKADYSQAYTSYVELHKKLSALTMNEAEKARKLDILRYEYDEIEAAKLEAGEEERLQEQRDIVRNAQHILEALGRSYQLLNGGDEGQGAAQMLADAAREMEQASRFTPDFSAYADTLNEAYYSVRELASDISSRLSDFEFDEFELERLEERLDVIYRLKQKYGPTVEDVLAYGQRAGEELELIEFSDEKRKQLQTELDACEKVLRKLANELSKSRTQAFDQLNSEISDALAFLNMPGIRMALKQEQCAYTANGQDIIELYISANPGEAPKPLAKIASGGELARIMLAVKSALAGRDDVHTVIYDEIDTGVSGMAAGRIGQMLFDTAQGRQVICVTHTAQVASYAQNHLLIEKHVKDGRTYTDIRALTQNERAEELARIISGDHITDIAHANALEMLQLARAHGEANRYSG